MSDVIQRVEVITDLNDPKKEKVHVIEGNVSIVRVFCADEKGDLAEVVIGYQYDMPGPGKLDMYKKTTKHEFEALDDVFPRR